MALLARSARNKNRKSLFVVFFFVWFVGSLITDAVATNKQGRTGSLSGGWQTMNRPPVSGGGGQQCQSAPANKDVEGLNAANQGKLAVGDFSSGYLPCIVSAYLNLIEM